MAFCTVMVLVGFIIPQILLIAFCKNLFDDIDPRKIHKGSVPRLGGIAFFPSILFAMIVVLGICMIEADKDVVSGFIDNLASLCFMTAAIIILYLIGMADDPIGIKVCGLHGNDEAGHINLGVVAFSPLLIPCCDVVRVYLHRTKQHCSPFLPDKTHIHHKLLALGMTQRHPHPRHPTPPTHHWYFISFTKFHLKYVRL